MPEPISRPLLILDVDETLIFGAESELEHSADFRVGPFHVYRRPHLQNFLEAVAQWYDLAIWSSATIDYVGEIARVISPPGVNFKFVWGRERCTQRMHWERLEAEYIKDLKKVKRLGYSLNRILFVDDTASKLSRNFGNAIYISSFTGANEDGELLLLVKFLESIRLHDNFRALEKRGWRARL
jgi:TFIIF-interacting CTD phosphatase-like protein